MGSVTSCRVEEVLGNKLYCKESSANLSSRPWGSLKEKLTSFDGFAISVKAGGIDMVSEVTKQCGRKLMESGA